MIRPLFFLIFFFLLNNSLVVAASPPTLDNLPQALLKQVQGLSELLRDSYATWYPEATRAQFVRLNDGEKLVLVVFTVEGFDGGNNHTQYFAVFSPETEQEGKQHFSLIDVMPIAGGGWRGIDIDTFRPKVTQESQSGKIVIAIDALEDTPGDSPNFPSKKITINLLLKKNRFLEPGGRLVEQNLSSD